MPALGVALITGATDGIGLHTARRCVERGRDVVVHGRDVHRVERAIEAVEAHARARGSSASARGLVRDLSTVDGAKGLVEDVLREHGDVDAVFRKGGGKAAVTTHQTWPAGHPFVMREDAHIEALRPCGKTGLPLWLAEEDK